jgi:hypothetical protein
MGPPPARPGSGFGDWWNDDVVKKELVLSARAVASIDRIYRERSKRLEALRDEVNKQLTEMWRLRDERTVDEATYALQVWRFESMQARYDADRNVLQYRLFMELSPEQNKKLQRLREIDRQNRGRGGSQ